MMQDIGDHYLESYKVSSLIPSEIEDMVAYIRHPYLWFSSESTDEDIRKRLTRHPNTRLNVLSDKKTRECTGFSVFYTENIQGKEVMFRGGTVILDRSKGLYKRIIEEDLTHFHADCIVTKTQNPRVFETLRSFSPTNTSFPSFGDMSPPEWVLGLAYQFCEGLNFDPRTFVLKDLYEPLRRDCDFKVTKDPSIGIEFAKRLGERDAFFVVVPLS